MTRLKFRILNYIPIPVKAATGGYGPRKGRGRNHSPLQINLISGMRAVEDLFISTFSLAR